ncbi:hypothetical protein K493DRAFT_347709 [Basidiobolus meristosporus CBS 931.73]|uniref:Uncharacterized protein n=1 Tax=Basidiobolus meristosporus CBS 931.73 TaxID=1314790 RepID=A0A1Y1YS63_9FUNG|nr:hypothetical protein K493DRAFT_347709 [Basidiobolus meristosporus CBS 931.73]|eukprot:ORY00809.1 hypothetical protein K493DRAFT_347709 [Basidiobolus meristosporus CBS 931.73]
MRSTVALVASVLFLISVEALPQPQLNNDIGSGEAQQSSISTDRYTPVPTKLAAEPRPTLNNSSRTVSGTTAYKASPIRTRSVPTSECSQPPGPPTYSTTSTANTEKSTHVKATVVPSYSARQSECSQPPSPPTSNIESKHVTSTPRVSLLPNHSVQQTECSQPPAPPAYTSVKPGPAEKSAQERAWTYRKERSS